jgi:hypothetical protein
MNKLNNWKHCKENEKMKKHFNCNNLISIYNVKVILLKWNIRLQQIDDINKYSYNMEETNGSREAATKR